MMYNTIGEAIAALNSLNSSGDALKADLLNLVKQVSIQADGAVTNANRKRTERTGGTERTGANRVRPA